MISASSTILCHTTKNYSQPCVASCDYVIIAMCKAIGIIYFEYMYFSLIIRHAEYIVTPKFCPVDGKGKGHPRTEHEGPEEE
jgi:hypothetical protein